MTTRTSTPTLLKLADDLRHKRTTSITLTETALVKAADVNGEGARVFTKRTPDLARALAAASDSLRSVGVTRSPLDGLTVSIKDLFDVQGDVTTAGSVVLKDQPPARHNAVVINRLINAGAVLVGRTNMTEFAYSGLGINPHYGTPKNPWERDTGEGRISGGSSSGAAISVTDGMAAAAVGSDTGGSVRIPAALCGLTGFKPTAHRVSMEGVLPLSRHLDSIGAITADATSCAAMDAVLSGETYVAPVAMPLRGLRLLVPGNFVLDGMDAVVSSAFQSTISKLSAAGAIIVEQVIPELDKLPAINAKGGFTAAEAWEWHHALVASRMAEYDPRVVSRIARGKDMTAADLLELIAIRQSWIDTVSTRLMSFDAVIMPTVPVVAPRIADLTASDEAYFAANGLILRNPSVINFLDGCALSIPCHDVVSAPVGLSIASTGGRDRQVLGIGLAIEALLAA